MDVRTLPPDATARIEATEPDFGPHRRKADGIWTRPPAARRAAARLFAAPSALAVAADDLAGDVGCLQYCSRSCRRHSLSRATIVDTLTLNYAQRWLYGPNIYQHLAASFYAR